MVDLQGAIDVLVGLDERIPAPRAEGTISLVGDELRIDNPRARGAISVGMMVQLARCVRRIVDEAPPSVTIVNPTSGQFCSGGHLEQVRGALGRPAAGVAMCAGMTAVLDALARSPTVVVAAVDGPAIGGGAELLTAASVRVFSPRGRIGFIQGRLGLSAGWGGAYRLSRIVGDRQAVRILTEAAVLDADEAMRRGLADHLVPFEARPGGGPWEGASAQGHSTWNRPAGEAFEFGRRWGSAAHRAALMKSNR